MGFNVKNRLKISGKKRAETIFLSKNPVEHKDPKKSIEHSPPKQQKLNLTKLEKKWNQFKTVGTLQNQN